MKISQIQIVVGFEFDQAILLSCGPALKSLKNKLKGQIFTISAPEEAPPSLPRAVVKLEDTIFELALDRIQTTARPPAHVSHDIKQAIHFARQRVLSFLEVLGGAIPVYRWSGIITNIQFPETPLQSRSASEASTPIFDRLISVNRHGKELGSFEFKFAVKEADYFVGYLIAGYERRHISIKVSTEESTPVLLNSDEFPVIDAGIEIQIDINNKPTAALSSPANDIDKIINRQLDAVRELKSDLNLEGLIE